MNSFKKSPHYLLKYSVQTIIIFSFINAILYLYNGISFEFKPSSTLFLLPLLGVLFCGLPSSILHNCAHSNFKPHWLNQLLGEICGTIMLYGFKGFQVAHMYHHMYPDNPTYDPHPPRGQSFPYFLISPVKATLSVLKIKYFEIFGKNKITKKNVQIQELLFKVSSLLKVLFFYLLLGPEFFILAYLPIYLGNILIFAHINYVGHIENESGTSEIINLNHNLYYKYINLVSCGGYFHKSHHLKPSLINPKNLYLDNRKKLLTYSPRASFQAKEQR